MQQIVHTVLLHQTEQNGEEAGLVTDYLLSSQNVFLQNESQNLNDLHATNTHFGSGLSRSLQLLTTLINKVLKQRFEGSHSVGILRQHKRHISEVGKQDRRVINRYIFFITHHILDHFAHNLK